jgi:hypothetical protein
VQVAKRRQAGGRQDSEEGDEIEDERLAMSGGGKKKMRPYHNRSRIAKGLDLLPTVDNRTIWASILRDTLNAMIEHCGGPDAISEPKRMAARRSAVLETELLHMEDKIAAIRASGGEPEERLLDLYGRLAGHQKRQCEAVGYERQQRDITPLKMRQALLIKKDEADDVET